MKKSENVGTNLNDKKKSSRPIIITISVLLLLSCCCCGGIGIFSDKDEESESSSESSSEISVAETTEDTTEETTEKSTKPETTTEEVTENNITVSSENFADVVKETMKDVFGEDDESISDIVLQDDILTISVDLSKVHTIISIPSEDVAVAHATSITDAILDFEQFDKFWNEIIIDFGDVGFVSRTKNDIIKNEYGMRCFDISNLDNQNSVNEDVSEVPSMEETPDVPKEYKNALKQAESYSDNMHMSKIGIYKQLTSEYGGQFSEEAATYAIENLVADFNANALATAKSYSESMYMSKAGIYNQLVSEYGEEFTESEAQYAVDNLEADYNYNALKKAESYQESMAMSPNDIYDQLVSEYGEQFTPEEAQYAIDNLSQ